MLNLVNLLDDAKCFETVRHLRWPEGVRCLKCGCEQVTKRGKVNNKAYLSATAVKAVAASLTT